MLTIRRNTSTSFAPTGFLLLTVNVFIEIFNSHLPKAPYPFDPALDCQASDCKPDVLLVADHLVKILACDPAAPISYNSVDRVYEPTRAITSQFKPFKPRHRSYFDFFYKTGKTEFSI